jgi:hypothetical protein
MDISLDRLDEYTEVTVRLDPYQLAVLDLAFDGKPPEEALAVAWQMVSERLLREKLASLQALNSSLALPAIAEVEDHLGVLYSSPEGCPCFPG